MISNKTAIYAKILAKQAEFNTVLSKISEFEINYSSSSNEVINIEDVEEYQDLWDTLEGVKHELFDLNMEFVNAE